MTKMKEEDLKNVNGGYDATSVIENAIGMTLADAKSFFKPLIDAANENNLKAEATLFSNLLNTGDVDVLKYVGGTYTAAFSKLKELASQKGLTEIYNKLNSISI